MKKSVITLYVNNPMGKRWELNLQSARRVQDEHSAEIVVINKSSLEYCMEKNPPPCPSVMVNDRFIAKNDIVTYETLNTELLNTREV